MQALCIYINRLRCGASQFEKKNITGIAIFPVVRLQYNQGDSYLLCDDLYFHSRGLSCTMALLYLPFFYSLFLTVTSRSLHLTVRLRSLSRSRTVYIPYVLNWYPLRMRQLLTHAQWPFRDAGRAIPPEHHVLYTAVPWDCTQMIIITL